jgi:hypothetical protein
LPVLLLALSGFTEAAAIRSPLDSKANLSSARLRVTSWHAIISLS